MRKPGQAAYTVSKMHRHAVLVVRNDIGCVRYFTPTECERLLGFTDGYTDIPGATESERYATIGNSMAVPVMGWIGRRITEVEALNVVPL